MTDALGFRVGSKSNYTPRNIDGIFGEIMTGSSLLTMTKKMYSGINLSTIPFYSIATEIFMLKFLIRFKCLTIVSGIRNIKLLFP